MWSLFPIWTGEGKLLVKKNKDGASALCGDWGGWWWTSEEREKTERREGKPRQIYYSSARARKTQRHEHAQAHAHAVRASARLCVPEGEKRRKL